MMFRFPEAGEQEDGDIFGAVIEEVDEQPDGLLRVRLLFWNDLARVYVTPGARFEAWYARTLGEDVVLPWSAGGAEGGTDAGVSQLPVEDVAKAARSASVRASRLLAAWWYSLTSPPRIWLRRMDPSLGDRTFDPLVSLGGESSWCSLVGVAAMADVHDGDGVVLVVDEVANAIFPAACAPLALEGFAQRCSDSVRIGGEGSVEEFHAGAGCRLGESFGQLARRRPGYLHSVCHRSTRAGLVPVGQQPADLGFVEDVTAGDVTFGFLEPLLRLRVGEQLQRGLDRLQVLGGEQDDVVTTVLGDVHPLVGPADLIGNLGEPGLRIGQR